MVQTKVVPRSPKIIPEIIQWLEAGEVIVLPTDTTYALVANALLPEAVAQFEQLKGKGSPQPYAMFLRQEIAPEYIVVDSDCERLLAEFPYPVTLIVPARTTVPEAVTNGFKNIFAVCPDQFIYDLIDAVPFPMACTAASYFGGIKAVTAEQALQFFGGKVPFLVDGGKSKYGRSGTLIDMTVERPAILTYGPVSFVDLRAILPDIELPSHMRK